MGTLLLINAEQGALQDVSSYGRALTSRGNLPVLSTAQKKFGTQSLYFDQNRDLVVPLDFPLLDGREFTIRFWVWPEGIPNWRYHFFRVINASDNSELALLTYTDPSQTLSLTCGGELTPNTFNQIEYGVKSGRLYTFVNGILVRDQEFAPFAGAVSLMFGANYANDYNASYNLLGWIDEIELVDHCLHTESFTPPTQASVLEGLVEPGAYMLYEDLSGPPLVPSYAGSAASPEDVDVQMATPPAVQISSEASLALNGDLVVGPSLSNQHPTLYYGEYPDSYVGAQAAAWPTQPTIELFIAKFDGSHDLKLVGIVNSFLPLYSVRYRHYYQGDPLPDWTNAGASGDKTVRIDLVRPIQDYARTSVFEVEAVDDAAGIVSNIQTFCEVNDLTPPTAPAWAMAQIVGDADGVQTVRFSWNPSADDVAIAGYRVFPVADGVRGASLTPDLILGVSTLFTAAALEGKSFEVVAVDASGKESVPASVLVPRLFATLPPSVEGPFLSFNPDTEKLAIRWKLHGTDPQWEAGTVRLLSVEPNEPLSGVSTFALDPAVDGLSHPILSGVQAVWRGVPIRAELSVTAARTGQTFALSSPEFVIPVSVAPPASKLEGPFASWNLAAQSVQVQWVIHDEPQRWSNGTLYLIDAATGQILPDETVHAVDKARNTLQNPYQIGWRQSWAGKSVQARLAFMEGETERVWSSLILSLPGGNQEAPEVPGEVIPEPVVPNLNLPPAQKPGVRLALALLRSALPTGRGWFSPWALRFGEIGRLLKAIAVVGGTFLETVTLAKKGLFRKEATGEYLKRWGDDLKIPKKENETDDAYRARMDQEIFRKRAVKPAVDAFLQEELGIQPEYSLPWKEVFTWDGTRAWDDGCCFSDDLYTGGTLVVITEDATERIKPLMPEILGIGVVPHYKHRVGSSLGPPRSRTEGDFPLE